MKVSVVNEEAKGSAAAAASCVNQAQLEAQIKVDRRGGGCEKGNPKP